jgi:hypothetical protein
MTEEAADQNDSEIGKKILQWLDEMPQAEDLHHMLISLAAVSTADNKVEVTRDGFDAIADWAQMLCQNLEMVALFRRGMLIARADENGELAVDFSAAAAEIIEKSKQASGEK